jgi:hypothetical protein
MTGRAEVFGLAPKPSVITAQQFSLSTDYSMILLAAFARVVAAKGLDV